ncbi:MAG: 50S ribosomal protein L23 [Holosporales bacterium]|jgi:large subunit ribosomal protein L23|nr:50S ribosomal protein L23 [Holosporales bacterium]
MASMAENRTVFKDYDILRYPITSEKSMKSGGSNQYFFVVDKKATKQDVKNAVERIFEVKVKSVNTLIRKGKVRTFKGHLGRLSDTKRAMVCLENGHSIRFVSGV